MLQPPPPLNPVNSETRHSRKSHLQQRFACEIIGLVVVVLSIYGCGREQPAPTKVESSLFDIELRLPKSHLERLPFELRSSTELKLEIAHLSGEPVSVILMDKKDLNNFERDFRDLSRLTLSFYTVMSRTGVDDRFDSDWQQFSGPAVYTILIWPKNQPDAAKALGTSVVHVRLLQRK
jgi:hypothetical protein